MKFILSKKKVLEQYNKAKDAADFVSYSSKTNPLITPILEEETDCFFSIHMKNELKHIEDRSRVLFLAQAWTSNEIQELIDLEITHFTLDNETDLDTLLAFLKDKDNKITLFLRLKLKEHSLRTEKYFVFGMASEVIKQRIKELQDHKNIEKLGLHFHRKTQNMSEWNYKYELETLEEILPLIDIVNMGGGLPSEYANTNVDVINSIFNKIQEFRTWLKEFDIQLMVEPGRFIAAPSIKLITKIVGLHDNNIIVDASVYNTDMDALIVPVKLLVEGEKKEGTPYVIKGITPCSMDLFRYRVYLDDPKVGDELTFLNAGAYNFTTEFCDLDKIETEVIE